MFKKYYNLIIIIIISLIALSLLSCSEDEPAPSFDVKITVIDSSGIFNKIQNGNFGVPKAKVVLKSLETGREFIAYTDSLGIAKLLDIQSGSYDILIERIVTPEEMYKATGNNTESLLTGQLTKIFFNPGSTVKTIGVNFSKIGTLIFSEIYYNGAPAPPTSYFHDQYTEIYNNTDSILYVDGIILANVYKDYITDNQYIHASIVWQFPGSGKEYPIYPGGFIIVAQDGIDHRLSHPKSIDLRDADFEYYNERTDGKDLDNPAVKNMIRIKMNTQFDWNYGVGSDAIIMAKVPDVNALQYDSQGNLLIPISSVIDGVEWIADLNMSKKKLHPSIDVSATGGIPMYSGKSIERKIIRMVGSRAVLSDMNNSLVDFDTLSAPTYRKLH
ncbi:MAG TPA: DUF4876 domain-containing protein [Ignavibacteria bacterium]|jgi:hypothetical protein